MSDLLNQIEVTEELRPSYIQPILYPSRAFPWISLLTLILALIGQFFFEPPRFTSSSEVAFYAAAFEPRVTSVWGVAFYLAALALIGVAISRGEWALASLAADAKGANPFTYRRIPLLVSIALALWAFILSGNNLFTLSNVVLWISSVMFFIRALSLRNYLKR